MRRRGKTAIRKSACVRSRGDAEYTWKEDWKGNDLVACVQMSMPFVAARTVFQCLVKSRPAALLVPASSMVLDHQHLLI